MKRWLIIIGIAFMLTGQARGVAQEPRMAEPTYSKGDTWTYAIESPGRPRQMTTISVIQATADAYVTRTQYPDGREETLFIPRKNVAIGNIGNVGINWPLSIGQRWSTVGRLDEPNPPTPTRVEISVDAYEFIAVPAGTLGAFRILMRACIDALLQSACGSKWMWVSPQAKAIVKWEIDDAWRIWGDSRGLVMVLVSYTVAP